MPKYRPRSSKRSSRPRYGKRKRYRAKRRKSSSVSGKRSARGLRIHRTRRTLPSVQYPLVPLPPRKALTLVWRDTIPLRIDDLNNPLMIRLNDIHNPIDPQSNTYITSGSGWSGPGGVIPPSAFGYQSHQPYNHDLMCQLYNKVCVISAEVTLRAIPSTSVLPNPIGAAGLQAPTDAMRKAWQDSHMQIPYRIVMTKDPTLTENLIDDVDVYRETQVKNRTSGFTAQGGKPTISSVYSTNFSALSLGGTLRDAFTRAPSAKLNYDVRKFWRVLKYKPTFVSDAMPDYRLMDRPGVPVTQSGTSAAMASLAQQCPWQQDTRLSIPGTTMALGTEPYAKAYARVQLLSEHPGTGNFALNPDVDMKNMAPVLFRVTIKQRCVFFDRSAMSMPHETDDI